MLLVLAILCQLFCTSESVDAPTTKYNSTGQYYELTNSLQTTIRCNHTELCYVECTKNSPSDDGCAESTIYSDSAKNLILICNTIDSCKSLTISSGPQIEADIFCIASPSLPGSTCSNANFYLSNTNIINLQCDNSLPSPASTDGACYSVSLWAENSHTVNVDCQYYDCRSVYIYSSNTNQLKINCNDQYACEHLTIPQPNYQQEYALSIQCSNNYHTCYSVDITVENGYTVTNNYMELKCERANTVGACNIRWTCTFPGSSTSTIFSSSSNRFVCNDFDCCPWTNANDMTQPPTPPPTTPKPTFAPTQTTSIPTKAPTTMSNNPTTTPSVPPTPKTNDPTNTPTTTQSPTQMPSKSPTKHPTLTPKPTKKPTTKYVSGGWPGYTLFVRGFNIWSLETSGNAILDINFESNVEGYTTEGSSCSYSSLEFDTSYSSYEEYSKSDSTSISAGFSTAAGGAGGTYSKERTETRSFASSKQTLIFSMDLHCSASQASIVAYNELYFSSNFINNLRTLPTSFDENNEQDLERYTDFWDSFGTHVMKTAKFGGRIKGAVTVDKCSVLSSYSKTETYQMCLNAAYKGATAEGCHGESETHSSGQNAEASVSNKLITVRGGDNSEFTNIFNSFSDKTNDFQRWINDLEGAPYVIGGNLDEIYDVIEGAILLKDHKLNYHLSDENALSDDEWKQISSALQKAYEYQSGVLTEKDLIFSADDCGLTCSNGQLDVLSCKCLGCSVDQCCNLSTAFTVSMIYIFIFCFFSTVEILL